MILFYQRKRFDLLYPSYGDTYPMYLGAIGMTYKQAGGGLGIDNDEGIELTLKDRILHHYMTGISTVEMGVKHKTALNEAFQKFYAERNAKYSAFVLEGNPQRLRVLQELLEKHDIEYKALA